MKLFLQKRNLIPKQNVNLIPDPEQNVKGISMIDKKSYAYCLIL